jgi:methionyl-tRNA formyltransferase
MKKISAVFLMSELFGKRAFDLAKQARIDLDVVILNDLNALEHAFSRPHDLLLSFGTGTIIPPWILEMEGILALNVHAASPDYPGRDPHHFAVYDGIKKYGATMHYITHSVDAGPIIDVELFDVPSDISPVTLLEMANDAGWKLIQQFFSNYKKQEPPRQLNNIDWGKRKSTRKMFLEMCRVDMTMSQEEISRRLIATSMPGYRNLYIDLYGHRYRIEDHKL